MLKRLPKAIICGICFLYGCSTPLDGPWVNDKLPPGREGALQEMSDKVLCRDVAFAQAPMPAKREYLPVPSGGFTFSGQAMTFGNGSPSNTQFYGTARPAHSFSSDFAAGYNMGSAIGEAISRNRWHNAYAECMQKLGWTQRAAGSSINASSRVIQKPLSPLGAVCRYTGDCEGTAICKNSQCAPRP
jgi:hypothetical protein